MSRIRITGKQPGPISANFSANFCGMNGLKSVKERLSTISLMACAMLWAFSSKAEEFPNGFEQMKSRAFMAPDSVYSMALDAYDAAWLAHEPGLVQWSYLLGLTSYVQGAFMSSNAWYKEALGHLPAEAMPPEEKASWSARIWNNIGINCEILKEFEAAAEAYAQSRFFEQQLGNSSGEWETALNEGLLLTRQGDLEAATQVLNEAIDHFQSTGDALNEGKAWLNLAAAEMKAERWSAASDALSAALNRSMLAGDSTEVCKALVQQAELQVVQGAFGDIADIFSSIDRWRPAQENIRQAHSEQVMRARWALHLGDTTQAQQFMARADTIANQIPSRLGDANSLFMHTQLAFANGDGEAVRQQLLAHVEDFEKRTNILALGYSAQVESLRERQEHIAKIHGLKRDLEHSEKLRTRTLIALFSVFFFLGALVWIRTLSTKFEKAIVRLSRRRAVGEQSLKNANTTTEDGKHDELYQQLVREIEREALHLDANITLNTLASRLNSNSRYVSDAIKTACNMNFNDFINEKRIDASVQFMLDPGNDHLSMEQIANQSGFNNLRTFYRNFSRVMQVTPAKFRKIAHSNRLDGD